jgi:phosphatidylglycerophosphatase A
MNTKNKIIIFLATGFFVGKFPFAPGTFGSLLAIPICFILSKTESYFSIIFISVFILLSIFLAGKTEKIIGEKDPGIVVIDEIAGMILTLLFIPFNFITIITGFILFRIFDILKPFPIGYIDKNLKGGAGIVLDDVVAGIFANIALRLILIFFPLV